MPPAQTPSATGAVANKNVGRPPAIALEQMIAGHTWHVVQPVGTFSHNLAVLTQMKLSDSALSERRQSLGPEPWKDALLTALRPLADPVLHPAAFYKGLRLVGVDGTTMNVGNTPVIKAKKIKTKSRRGLAAFFRIGCAALCELGTHLPVAVRIGEHGESEGALAGSVVEQIESNDLLIADRYYGNGKWAARLMGLPKQPQFMVRVQQRLKATTVEWFKDGSRLIAVNDPDSTMPILLREIKGRVRRPGKRWVSVRFWTNLFDAALYPSHELLALYVMRWEQEIAFREIKEHLHHEPILQSHTLITAVQEVCALFMAQAIICRARSAVGHRFQVPIMQVSYQKTLNACRNLCWLLSLPGVQLSDNQMRAVIRALENDLARQLSPPRRSRSCPRAVRQPIDKWPRLLKNTYQKGAFQYEVKKS